MISSTLLSLSALALLPLSLAAPAPMPVPEAPSADVAAIQWTPVDFNGATIYVNSAAIIGDSNNPAEEVKQALGKRGDEDMCNGSTVNSHPPPFANTADCEVIRNWAGTQRAKYGVWDRTPDTHALFWYGTCVFEAGTREWAGTNIGSYNIRDIMTLALNKWQSGGVVASQGETQCWFDASGGYWGPVRWTIKRY